MSTILLFLFIALLVAGLLIQRAEIGRLEGEATVLRAERQSLSDLRERADDATALEAEKRAILRVAAEQSERVRVLETALREILPSVRRTAEEYRTGDGKPIPCDAWGAVASIEQALGIQSDD